MANDMLKTLPQLREPTPTQLTLVSMGDTGTSSYPLPSDGKITIGRGDTANIRIDDASISRVHATLHIGRTIQIEDAGSSNGTYLQGQQLEPNQRLDIQPGDYFELGDVTCLIKGPSSRERLRALRSHAYFEARLQDEVARARDTNTYVSVVRIHLPADDAAVEAEMLAAVRPGDVVARYAPAEYEVLLAGIGQDDAEQLAQDIVGKLITAGLAATSGIGAFPRHGISPEALLSAACDAVIPQVATAGGDAATSGALVVADPKMVRLHTLVDRVAKGGVNVLLLGETGVGKEVFAERLHAGSSRADKTLLRLNCAAFSQTLLESELFGHERGAFTGAERRKIGLLESADGGTVFLDEIGEMDLGLQAKLLRVIESKMLRRVGGLDDIPIDVTFIGATNRDLEAEVAAKRFRADLFFRLNGFSVLIPPLRERPGDIDPFIDRFLALANQRMGGRQIRVTDEARAVLRAHRWPGNIRELRNAIDRGALLALDGVITVEHLPVENMGGARPVGNLAHALSEGAYDQANAPSGLTPEELADRAAIVAALANALGNQSRAADELGISRRWLSTKMDRYQIPKSRSGR